MDTFTLYATDDTELSNPLAWGDSLEIARLTASMLARGMDTDISIYKGTWYIETAYVHPILTPGSIALWYGSSYHTGWVIEQSANPSPSMMQYKQAFFEQSAMMDVLMESHIEFDWPTDAIPMPDGTIRIVESEREYTMYPFADILPDKLLFVSCDGFVTR